MIAICYSLNLILYKMFSTIKISQAIKNKCNKIKINNKINQNNSSNNSSSTSISSSNYNNSHNSKKVIFNF